MASARDEFARHCIDLLSPMGGARSRRMFGGFGLYVDDVFVALIAIERLYLKVDAQTRPRFEAAGCEPFVYDGGKARCRWVTSARPKKPWNRRGWMQPWAAPGARSGLAREGGQAGLEQAQAAAAAPAAAARRRKTPATPPTTKAGARKP